jgi:hypothetical protein
MTATRETNRATPLPYQEITVHTNTLDIEPFRVTISDCM